MNSNQPQAAVLPVNQEPKRIVIPYQEGEMKIDAVFDEPQWKQAAIISPFYLNNGTKEGTEATELRLFYDDKRLYLGWTCTDSDIQATLTQRDASLWDEEVAEAFLAPHDPCRYFELQWNPLGTIFDAIITNQVGSNGLSIKINGDHSFTAQEMKSAVIVDGKINDPNVKDKEWRVEVAIPFSDLQTKTPVLGDVWRGAFYRYNRTTRKALELLAWSPTLTPSFHEPSRFGYIEFGDRPANIPFLKY
ncbi:MAG: carbohydrate-binding family 9-like protein [Candidatus Omnitrophota bacterium]